MVPQFMIINALASFSKAVLAFSGLGGDRVISANRILSLTSILRITIIFDSLQVRCYSLKPAKKKVFQEMKCPYCLHENPEGSRLCIKCKEPLHPSIQISSGETKTIRISTDDLNIGAVIAEKYKLTGELGRGGMGVVYEAEDRKLKRKVALKFLPPEMTSDSEARERFVQEAQTASGLDHPNICTIHEIDETRSGQMYIAMARYRGEALKEKIKHGPVKLEEALDLAIQTAQGMAKAHERGIIHRDIKPANIIVTDDGIVKIVDFGLAKLSGESRLTQTGTTIGTVAYMSPEQARGEAVDQRTDVWSLGVVLYELISGQLPFRGENEQALVYSILNREPEPIKDLPNAVPLELRQILQKALAKDPEKRYASGKELALSLEELKRKLISTAPSTSSQMIFRRPRKRMMIGVSVGILVCAIILGIWLSTRTGLAFQESDKLLLADVDNQTADEVFELALRTAIESDLQQSPYANVFDRAQVSETLRLMRKDANTRIDEELGCDICRFSGVRALILPRILSAGEAYELQAILIDPVQRSHVDRIRVNALGKEEVLLHAIDRLARKLRSRLGESIESIEKADMPVIKVTTSSWEALQYLAKGKARRLEGKFKEAARFFELAIEKDAHFASAKSALGLVLIQFLKQEEKGKEMLRQALVDAGELPQREYLMIKAVNLWYVDEDLEGALDEYRIIRELYPDLWPAYNNPGIILKDIGRYDEAVAMFEKAAELANRNGIPLANLWFTHLNYRKDPQAAEDTARRLVELAPGIAYYHHWLGYSLAAQGRFTEAAEAFRKCVELEPQHPYGLPNLGHVLLAKGAADEAVPIYREVRELVRLGRIPGSYPKSSFDLALALRESDELEEAKRAAAQGREAKLKELEGTSPNVQDLLILGELETLSGRIDEAKKYLDKALKEPIQDPYTSMNLAEIYALLGQDECAIETLKETLDSGYSDPFFPLILPAFQSIRDNPRFIALFNFNQKNK
jgi:serine/threonine protein kinase/Flp pilus assembly protein TadD